MLQLNSNLVSTQKNPTLSFFGSRKPLLNPPQSVRYRKAHALKCRQSEYYDYQQQQQRFAYSEEPSFSSPGGGGIPLRMFVGHSIYKGKAAMTVEPRAPEFSPLDSGAYKLSKEGFLLLQFAPAAGMCVYDWSKKQVFSLSVVEIVTLIGLGARDSSTTPLKEEGSVAAGITVYLDRMKGINLEFSLHPYSACHGLYFMISGPQKPSPIDEGKIRKILKIEPLPDGSGHFFNLSVQNKLSNLDESIYIPITKDEFTVLVSAFNPLVCLYMHFILPYLISWNAFASMIRLEDTARPNNNATPRYGGDYQWNR